MIKSFAHRGLERLFTSGSKAGIQPAHAKKLRLQLGFLDAASKASDMAQSGWDLHALKGGLVGHWSIRVNGNWRMTFKFEGADAILVDYQDYH